MLALPPKNKVEMSTSILISNPNQYSVISSVRYYDVQYWDNQSSKVARRESVVSNSHLGQGKVLTVPLADIPHLSWKFMWAFLRTPVIRRLSESLFVFKTYHIFIFFSRTTGPISIKRGTKHPWVTGIQERSNEGIRPFQGEIITKIAKFKNLFLQNHLANFNQTWHKTLLHEEDSKLFK